MILSGLSADSLSVICRYLPYEAIAILYGTNNRDLMRRLTSMNVCPQIMHIISPSIHLARFIHENRTLQSYSLADFASTRPSGLAEEFEYVGIGQASFGQTLNYRQLLRLPPSLTKLVIPGNWAGDLSVRNVAETFDSLFPQLKTLVFFGVPTAAIATDLLADNLMCKLPQKLETLALLEATLAPRVTDLPASLTSLFVSHPFCMQKLGSFNSAPQLEIIRQLTKQCPLLKHLALPFAQSQLFGHPKGPKLALPSLTSFTIYLMKSKIDLLSLCALLCLPHINTLYIKTTGSTFRIEHDTSYESMQKQIETEQAQTQLPPESETFWLPIFNPNNVSLVLPPNLTSLYLSSERESGMEQSYLESLPRTLQTLSLTHFAFHWARNEDTDWNPVSESLPPLYAADPRLQFQAQQRALPSWLSFLPPSITDLELVNVVYQINELPPSLKRFKATTEQRLGFLEPEVDSAQPSTLKWPPSLSYLSFDARVVSKQIAKTLPPSLTHLECTLTSNWNQDDVKSLLLDPLPHCRIQIFSSRIWISGSTAMDPNAHLHDFIDHNGSLDIPKFLHYRLSHLPKRIRAPWKIVEHVELPPSHDVVGNAVASALSALATAGATATNDLAAIPASTIPGNGNGIAGIPTPIHTGSLGGEKVKSDKVGFLPLTLPPVASPYAPAITRLLVLQPTTYPFSYGFFEPFNVLKLLESSKIDVWRIEEATKGQSTEVVYCLPNFDYFLGLGNLKTLSCPSSLMTPAEFNFSKLPRSLTSVNIGLADFVHPGPNPTIFIDWQFYYRGITQNAHAAPVLFGAGQPPSALPSRSEDSLPAQLPRNLVECLISAMITPPIIDGWPTNLTQLSFFSSNWTDALLLQLSERLPNLQKMTVTGWVLAYGSQPILTDIAKVSGDVVRSLEHINISTLVDQVSAPLTAKNIHIQGLAIPSILAFASASTHSMTLIPERAPSFQVMLHKRIRHGQERLKLAPLLSDPGRLENQVDKKRDRLNCQEQLHIPSLCAYKSLTSLAITLFEMTWTLIDQLPKTLIHLAATFADVVPTNDPIKTLPPLLETLQLDMGTQIFLHAEDITKLPPNLTTLEANLMTFSPASIASVPRKITTLLFNGRDLWDEIDIFSLLHHLGDNIKLLTVNACLFSGALIPLESSSELSIPNMIEMTDARLGPKAKIVWLTIAQPLRLCAYDLTDKSTIKDLATIRRADLLCSRVDSILSLDCHLGNAQNLRAQIPHSLMPSNITSLNMRFSSVISAQDAVLLPATLKHLKVQVANKYDNIDPQVWPLLPRMLESFTVELVGSRMMTQKNRGYADPIAHSVVEDYVLAYSSTIGTGAVGGTEHGKPSTIAHMWGLPTEKLHTLSLRPYHLHHDCLKSFGSALRLVRCCYILELPQAQQTHPHVEFDLVYPINPPQNDGMRLTKSKSSSLPTLSLSSQ